jgi:hypothetical protein
MSEITLVRQQPTAATEEERAVTRNVLFGIIDGLGEVNRKRWRRFVNMLFRLEPGEMATITTHKARSGQFHRRHMKIEMTVFEAQERIADFEDFRLWLKIGAGHVTWMAGPRGGVVPVPKSISYAKLEDGEMREFHDNAVAFLRGDHAIKYLWPKMPDAQRHAAMDALMNGFGE